MAPTMTEVAPALPEGKIAELEEALGLDLTGGYAGYRGWAECPPRYVTPIPDVPGAWFDIDAVVRVVQVLRALPHTKGRWGGQPFEPAPWEVVWLLAPVFGWKHPDGHRIIAGAFLEVPRKNGKSSIASRLGVYLLAADGEMGPEVYSCATSEGQARQVFDEGRTVVNRAPDLKGRVEVLASVIRVPRTGGIFRVLSKLADVAHGLNVSGGIVDEVHLHKKRDLIDALDTGTGARLQPLMVYITTAGDADETTIYAEMHNAAIKVANGSEKDPSMYAVIFAASEDDDPFALETWAKANPNFPVSPSVEFLEKYSRKAQISPAKLPVFVRLNLNIRSELSSLAPISHEMWRHGVQMVSEDKLKGKPCWGGLVAASWNELSTINWTFRNPEGAGWWSLWRWFVPRASLPSLLDRTNNAADEWVKTGRLIVTDGNETDIERHVAQIRSDAARFDVRELAYDPNGTIGIVSPLHAEGRITCVPIFAQSAGSAVVDWQRLLMGDEYQHGNDPVMNWQISSLRAKTTVAGVLRIDRMGSPENVYGAVAAEMALRRAITGSGTKPTWNFDAEGVIEV